jgi:hypothetical protein
MAKKFNLSSIKKNWYTTAAYTNEDAYLRNYLRNGTNPYDYAYDIPTYLEHIGVIEDASELEDPTELGYEW